MSSPRLLFSKSEPLVVNHLIQSPVDTRTIKKKLKQILQFQKRHFQPYPICVGFQGVVLYVMYNLSFVSKRLDRTFLQVSSRIKI